MYEDIYEKNPQFKLPGEIAEETEVESEIEETGDPLIDEIERRMAKGEEVDDLLELMEAPKSKTPVTTLKTSGSFFKR